MAAFERADTSAKVVAIIKDKLRITDQDLALDTTFQDLGADSLDIVEIIMKLEEDFGIEIDDESAEKLMTVNDVITYVHRLRTK